MNGRVLELLENDTLRNSINEAAHKTVKYVAYMLDGYQLDHSIVKVHANLAIWKADNTYYSSSYFFMLKILADFFKFYFNLIICRYISIKYLIRQCRLLCRFHHCYHK